MNAPAGSAFHELSVSHQHLCLDHTVLGQPFLVHVYKTQMTNHREQHPERGTRNGNSEVSGILQWVKEFVTKPGDLCSVSRTQW